MPTLPRRDHPTRSSLLVDIRSVTPKITYPTSNYQKRGVAPATQVYRLSVKKRESASKTRQEKNE